MTTPPPQNRPRMTAADRIAIVALLIGILSLGITSYLSYFGVQTQKEIANLQATAQVQTIRLQQELQNNNALAHLELTSLHDGFLITNNGPAAATNINIIMIITDVAIKWQKYVNSLNQFSIEIEPAAAAAAINEIHAPSYSYGYNSASSKNAFQILMSSILPGDSVYVFINFTDLKGAEQHSYHGRATLYTYPQSVSPDSEQISNFLENTTYKYTATELGVADFNTTASCNECYFQYINNSNSYINEYLSVSDDTVDHLDTGSSSIDKFSKFYVWKYDLYIYYLTPKGIGPVSIPPSLYFEDTGSYFDECQPSYCVQDFTS